ncbi:MAG TPA: aminodeoxychorismate synthase component I [Cyclobacteriaceae bacterium]|nr:aminodeoxychorismate synthase component I [Cyclobacteriaceae bacterium]
MPFIFVVDFEEEKPVAFRVDEINDKHVLFDFNGVSNSNERKNYKPDLKKFPISFDAYRSRFEKVKTHLERGDSFLTNLTARTKIESNLSLRDIFYAARARYKLSIDDRFVCFSPETFVKIIDEKIYSYPMKGTIDASIPDAANVILNDRKEMAEHVTIVDLIRNDLSQVATNVTVKRFRYIDEIKTNHHTLLQVSSEIEGTVRPHYQDNIGDLIGVLLPAGSITGAPKSKTVDIIREAEGEKRGYYTGIAGYFDGQNLDTCVMIRFIERDGDTLYYRSGGGITTQSDVRSEYEELLSKIYVPVD